MPSVFAPRWVEVGERQLGGPCNKSQVIEARESGHHRAAPFCIEPLGMKALQRHLPGRETRRVVLGKPRGSGNEQVKVSLRPISRAPRHRGDLTRIRPNLNGHPRGMHKFRRP